MVNWCNNLYITMRVSTILWWQWCKFICSNHSRGIWIWFTILGWNFWISERFHLTFNVLWSRKTIHLWTSSRTSVVSFMIIINIWIFPYPYFFCRVKFSFVFSIRFCDLLNFCRISGNTASTKNIHCLVAPQLQQSLIKRKWKKAFNATSAIRQLQMLRLTHSPSTSSDRTQKNEIWWIFF